MVVEGWRINANLRQLISTLTQSKNHHAGNHIKLRIHDSHPLNSSGWEQFREFCLHPLVCLRLNITQLWQLRTLFSLFSIPCQSEPLQTSQTKRYKKGSDPVRPNCSPKHFPNLSATSTRFSPGHAQERVRELGGCRSQVCSPEKESRSVSLRWKSTSDAPVLLLFVGSCTLFFGGRDIGG